MFWIAIIDSVNLTNWSSTKTQGKVMSKKNWNRKSTNKKTPSHGRNHFHNLTPKDKTWTIIVRKLIELWLIVFVRGEDAQAFIIRYFKPPC